MYTKHPLLILFSLTLLGAFFRLNSFLISPPGFHIDESDIGYQAYSILKTGRDYHGNFLPIHPQSFADRRPFLYMYVITPSIAIFGLNEFAVRIPSAFFGILSIPAVYFLAQALYKGKNTQQGNLYGLITAFILAVLPWHIHYSRVGFELTFMLLFLILGLTFFLYWVHNSRSLHLITGLTFLILTIYIYSTAKLFIPLLLLALLLSNRKKIIQLPNKQKLLTAAICLILLIPAFKDALMGVGGERFAVISVFADKNSISEYMHLKWLSTYAAPLPPLNFIHPSTLAHLFLNQPANLFFRIANSYLSPFSPQFLIFAGDPNARHVIPASGVAGVVVSGLFFFGLVKLTHQKVRPSRVIIFAVFLLSPLAGAITREGQFHATRMFFFVLPLTLMSSFGALQLLAYRKKIVGLFLIIILLIFWSWEILRDQYLRLAVYPISGYSSYNWGWKDIARKIESLDKFDQIVIDNSEGAPIQTLYAFYKNTDPKVFQKYAQSSKSKYTDDKVSFLAIDLQKLSIPQNSLIILPKETLVKNNLVIETLNVKVIDKIKTPTGEDYYYFLISNAEDPSQL